MDCKIGFSRKSAIVIADSSSDSDLEGTELPVVVEGSPLKVLPRQNYSEVLQLFDDSASDSCDELSILEVKGCNKREKEDIESRHARKKLKFDDDSSPTTPIYEIPPPKYSADSILKILLDPNINKDKICKEKPCNVTESATYVVNIKNLQHPDDVKKDQFGIWNYSGSHPQAYRVYRKEGGYLSVEKCGNGATGASVVYLRRLHCTHPSNADFKRLICFVSDASNNPHHLCLLVYRLPIGFVPSIVPHGNSKEKAPFYPTWPSTMSQIKEESLVKGPKAAVEGLSLKVGGLLGAAASGQLPRNEKQISNAKQRSNATTSSMDSAADELFVVMQRAYAQDPMKKFIRDIKTAPEPAIVLADDQQIVDLLRFCTSSFEFGILTVDPTFSLGEFDVTPITYRHLLLETRRNNQPPVFLGPLLVHYRKTFSSYLFFASSLIGLNRQLEGIRAIGTDGEQPLIDAFLHEFGFAQHLTCFIHVRRNIKDKLSECSVPHELASAILNDIFGQKLGTVFQEGLVDAIDNDDYDRKLDIVIESWRKSSVSSVSDLEKFIKWFTSNKVPIIRNTMLRSIREECGLGNPPSIFTTNASESMNALLKHKVDYKKHQLPSFVDQIKEFVDEQKREVERAIVNRGKWQLRSQYRYLEVQESVWFTMNAQQHQKHISNVHSAILSEVQSKESESVPHYINLSSDKPSSMLSMEANTVAKSTNLPFTCVEGIWTKAKELLQKENAIVPAPGQSSEARMVLSYSSKTPHMVTPTKGGGFSCDSNCPNWKSIGMCAHSVAVAQVNGKLEEFISVVKKKKKSPNITALVTSTMPRGRGRKGGVPARTRKPTNPAEACTRVAMSVGTQVVSNVQSVGAASCATQNASTNLFHATPFFSSPSASSMPYPYSPHFPPSPAYDPWSMHPYMYPYPSTPSVSPAVDRAADLNPFSLCFIKGNISVCIGCKNHYEKNSQPPSDLCIKHQEWREFIPTGSETRQSKFSNVYYHCKPQCVWLRCANFNPSLLDTSDVMDQLGPIHKEYLALHFGIHLN